MTEDTKYQEGYRRGFRDGLKKVVDKLYVTEAARILTELLIAEKES